MNESILATIKKMLGLGADYTAFDMDIIVLINGAFMTLHQLAIGPEEGFSITGKTETWNDYLSDPSKIELVKSYIYLKVKLIFDPPLGSAVMEAINRQISEFEWRLNVAVDTEQYLYV